MNVRVRNGISILQDTSCQTIRTGGKNIVFCYLLLDCQMAWSKKEEKLMDLITESKMQGNYERKKSLMPF